MIYSWAILQITGNVSLWKRQVFFPPMKWDNFQSAITCAYTSSLWKQYSSQRRWFLFDFYNFYAAARSLLSICFELCLQCISQALHRSGSTWGSGVQPWPIHCHDVARMERLQPNHKEEVNVSPVCSLAWERISLALILEYVKYRI